MREELANFVTRVAPAAVLFQRLRCTGLDIGVLIATCHDQGPVTVTVTGDGRRSRRVMKVYDRVVC